MQARELRHRIAEFAAIPAHRRQRMPRRVTLQQDLAAGEGVPPLRRTDQVRHVSADPQAPVTVSQRLLRGGVIPLDDRGRINRLRRPVELLERDDPDGLTGQQRASASYTAEKLSQLPGVLRAQVRHPKPSFQPVAEKVAKARAIVPPVAMNPAQMILHAQLAVRPDRADHPHNGQPRHGVAPRLQMRRNMPAAGNPASATELLPPGIGEPPAPATNAGRPVARRAGRDRQPAQDTGPAGTSAGAAMLPPRRHGVTGQSSSDIGGDAARATSEETILVQARAPRPADESRRRTRTCDRATTRGQRDTLTNDRRKTPQNNGPLCAFHPSRTRHRPVAPSRRSGAFHGGLTCSGARLG
jgi:hypothetical protein